MAADDDRPARPAGLSRRIAARAPGAFEELHALYGPRLRSLFARRAGGRTDLVEDLVQQTWAAVWRSVSADRYQPERAAISTFVYAVANKIWLQHCRQAGRPTAVPDEAGPQGPPEDALASAELLEALQDCLRRPGLLDDEEREVALAAASGESERSLAGRLHLAASTINARKRTAYSKLRRCLSGKGFGAEMIEQLAESFE